MAWNTRRNVSEPLCQPSEFLHKKERSFYLPGEKNFMQPLFSRVSFNWPFKRWGYFSVIRVSVPLDIDY